jgi:thiol-disulfide isomerase/thioredoxin
VGLALLLLTATPARSQIPALPTLGKGFELAAENVDRVRFDAAKVRGNVTVVFYWSTGCAVCRDTLPELRANLAGWRNKPFSLVLVNVDRQAQDWQSYERVLGTFRSAPEGYISVRQDTTLPSPARLPLTLLLDAKGKVLQRIEGRVAPEVWDSVAELLL